MGPSALRVANLNARVAALGYEVEDLGNIAVEQAEACAGGDPRAKYLPQIAAPANESRQAGGRGAGARRACRWCWAATIRSRSAR
jgi:hypothetical protein